MRLADRSWHRDLGCIINLVGEAAMPDYEDGRISCTSSGLVIRMYYPWGSKRIAYKNIRSVRRREIGALSGQWRIWGSGDFKHWLNLDPGRRKKTSALDIDLGRRVVPVITPDDTDRVVAVLRSHAVEVTGS
jgi:hypothetical protein